MRNESTYSIIPVGPGFEEQRPTQIFQAAGKFGVAGKKAAQLRVE
jgi:hypothetical protein